MLNVDLGYLSFKLAFGGFESWQYKHGSNVAIAAIDSKTKRKELYPDYKKYRNSGKDDVLEMVWQLRREIEEEKLLPLCKIDGLEADDIVACWYLFNPNDDLIGVDKDFFQLPNMNHCFYHNMKAYTRFNCIDKLPAYVQELALANFALYQILLGDVADNIPRLLAKGKEGKDQITETLIAIEYKYLEEYLLYVFGNQVKINAGLVLLPYFEEGNFSMYGGDWFRCWCEGNYYQLINWQGLYDKILGCLGQNKVTQDNAVWDMFSLV